MNLLLKAYSLLVLCWDIVYLVFACSLSIIESVTLAIKPPREKPIDTEIVLVVGASRGVGRHLALQCAALGAQVVCWDINEEDNKATAREAGPHARAYTCDVSDREQVLLTAAEVTRDVGHVTMLFHCCGVPSPRVLTEERRGQEPSHDVRKTMDVSVMSHFWAMEAFLPHMVHLNRGHLVALTSVAGLTAVPHQVALCAAQFAVQGIMESLAEELRCHKHNGVHLTLAHIYPFISTSDSKDLRLRIPSYFGTIEPKEAARQIILGVRRNYMELSIPHYLLFLSTVVKILPRKASVLFRDLLDMGVDFC